MKKAEMEQKVFKSLLFNAILIMLEAFVGDRFYIKSVENILRAHARVYEKLKCDSDNFLNELMGYGELQHIYEKLEASTLNEIYSKKHDAVFACVFRLINFVVAKKYHCDILQDVGEDIPLNCENILQLKLC